MRAVSQLLLNAGRNVCLHSTVFSASVLFLSLSSIGHGGG